MFKISEMKRIAVFAGSFDPVTIGHESIVKRAIPLFDEIIVAIGVNTRKNSLYSQEQREEWLSLVFSGFPTVKVTSYKGLTIDYCKKAGASYLLRGIRNSIDFEYEMGIAQVNRDIYPDIETVFLMTLPEHSHINASIVREIIQSGGDASKYLPAKVTIK